MATWDAILLTDTEKGWTGRPEFSHDSAVTRAVRSPAEFTVLVKNAYRVLLTRGLKGCAVYFDDPQTRDFVLSRLDGSRSRESGGTE